jgi:Zn-dependent protease
VRGGIRLGRFGGAPIVGDASVFILILLFGVAVLIDLNASGVSESPQVRGIASIVAGVGVVVCLLLHELSHVAVARRRSMVVREIRLFIFGGYSVIAGEPSPGDEVAIAAAGPVTSLLLGGVAGLGVLAVGGDSIVGRTMWALMLANVAVGLFNLLPGFPLDGARVLRGALTAWSWNRLRATRLVNSIGRNTGWITMGLGALAMVARYPEGIYAVIGGWFLAQTALVAGRREELSVAFDGMTVGDIMRATPEAAPADATISMVLDLYALGPSLRPLPVEANGRVVGVIGQEEIDAVSPSRWASARVRSLMAPIGPADVVGVSDPLESLLLRPAGRVGAAVVVDEGRVVGIVDGQSLGTVL